MVRDRDKDLQNILNSSGYPFQIGIKRKIEASFSQHQWKVFVDEKAWKDIETEAEGFIDLVLHKKGCGGRMVIECKRPRDASWVFLLYDGSAEKQERIRCLGVDRVSAKKPVINWFETSFSPESPESDFCALRGKGEGDQPILERWSGILLKSLECYANEELQFPLADMYNVLYYIPVIVTTARLEACRFRPEDVSLEDGKISKKEFEIVPFIRFRKSLTTVLSPSVSKLDLKKANKEMERTIVVVNSLELVNFLERFDVT